MWRGGVVERLDSRGVGFCRSMVMSRRARGLGFDVDDGKAGLVHRQRC